jgi:hypothetical protein
MARRLWRIARFQDLKNGRHHYRIVFLSLLSKIFVQDSFMNLPIPASKGALPAKKSEF